MKGKALVGRGGFGLLELLIAMTILAIGTLGIMKLQMQSSFGNVSSRNQSAAANLARSKMEELKRVTSYAIQNLNDPMIHNEAVPELQDQNGSTDLGDWSNPDFTEGPFNESQDPSDPRGRIFTRSWNIADDTPIPDFKTIRVRVSWSENGRPRYVEMETQIGLKNAEYFE